MLQKKKLTSKKIYFLVLSLLLSPFFTEAGTLEQVDLAKQIYGGNLLSDTITSSTIPFTMEGGWIIIEAIVNRQGESSTEKERFILDTGAPTLFTKDFADRKSYHLREIEVNVSASETKNEHSKHHLTTEPSILRIGDMSLLQENIFVSNIDANAIRCVNINGLIGSNLLSKFIVSFDFQKKLITLYNKRKFDYDLVSGYRYKFPLTPDDGSGIPSPVFFINGKKCKTTWDTGFPGSVQYNVQKKEKGLNGAHVEKWESFGATGDFYGMSKKKKIVYEIKNTNITNEMKDIIPVPGISMFIDNHRTSIQALIGLEFMQRFEKMVLDWNKNDIYLINASSMPTSQNQRNKEIYIRYTEENKFMAVSVNTASQLYKNGLRAGDEVVSINGMLLSEMDVRDICATNRQLRELSSNIQNLSVRRNGQTKLFQH